MMFNTKINLKPFYIKFATVAAVFFVLLDTYLAFHFIGGKQKVLEPPKVDYSLNKYATTAAKRGDISEVIEGHGAVFVPAETLNLYFRQSGKLKAIYCKFDQLVKKGDLLGELDTDSLKNQIQQQEIIISKVQTTYQQLQAVNSDAYSLQQAAIDIELEKTRLGDLKKQLEQSKIIAPTDGKVISVEPCKPGESIEQYHGIIQIIDPQRLELTYTKNKEDKGVLECLKLGVHVQVILSKDETCEGTVVMTPEEVLNNASGDFKDKILIKLKDIPPDAQPDEIATIRLVPLSRSNVIILPQRVIHSEAGRNFVTVFLNGMKKERYVELGITDGRNVEILSGVKEGEVVLAD
jgi:membrane fusion protein, macrolide-specific efflux system